MGELHNLKDRRNMSLDAGSGNGLTYSSAPLHGKHRNTTQPCIRGKVKLVYPIALGFGSEFWEELLSMRH